LKSTRSSNTSPENCILRKNNFSEPSGRFTDLPLPNSPGVQGWKKVIASWIPPTFLCNLHDVWLRRSIQLLRHFPQPVRLLARLSR
jgi:hypothetical protein